MLKKSVEVLKGADQITVKYALWAVDLPTSWVEKHENIQQILNKKSGEDELPQCSPEEINIINLLTAQGCFEEKDKSVYCGKEILLMYQHVINSWYAKYYQHSLWDKIAQGLSTNQLVAWLIQNYHLSRSAGVTDSRCALFLPIKSLRGIFKQNAIEEYWHCEAFYFVNHPNLSISSNDIKRYIPLRSSIAFDQQMLRLAEEDPLGYVMVSYFQENSANFYNDCQKFYKTIEEQYNLEGFFKPWIKHLSYDFEYDHGDRYGELFFEFNNVSKENLLRSFKNAAIAIGYLFEAFDEILSQPDQEKILLRNPIDGKTESQILYDIFGKTGYQAIDLTFKSTLNYSDYIIDSYYKNSLMSHADNTLKSEVTEYIREAISTIAFRSMSFSYDHDQILTLGYIAQHLQKTEVKEIDEPEKKSEWTALINYIIEASHKPNDLIILIHYFNKLFYICYSVNILTNPIQTKLEKYIKDHEWDRLYCLNLIIPLFENFTKFVKSENIFYKRNFFKD